MAQYDMPQEDSAHWWERLLRDGGKLCATVAALLLLRFNHQDLFNGPSGKWFGGSILTLFFGGIAVCILGYLMILGRELEEDEKKYGSHPH